MGRNRVGHQIAKTKDSGTRKPRVEGYKPCKCGRTIAANKDTCAGCR